MSNPTLREQVLDVAIRHVNEPLLKAAGHVRAVNDLLCKAYIENWPRDSFDAQVILTFDRVMKRDRCVPLDYPGISQEVDK